MTIMLSKDRFRIAVHPSLGGGLSRFEALQSGKWQPVLRSAPPGADDPDQLALYPLCPWSNRLGAGGIRDASGQWFAFPPNRAGERYPLHGDGWQSAWEVKSQDRQQVRLTLESRRWPGCEYDAELGYALDAIGLTVSLKLTNRARDARWFGGGLHPWFNRDPDTTLQFAAEGVWESGPDLLPTRRVAVRELQDFSCATTFPEFTLDHCYDGWRGPLQICWPTRGLAVELTAAPGLPYCVVYAPEGRDFFCAEPVSHRNNAHSEVGQEAEHGLVLLQPEESWAATFRFAVHGQ